VAAAPLVLPVRSAPGTFTRSTASRTSYHCDLLGDKWCEQRASTRWTMREGTACALEKTVIDYPMGPHAPEGGSGKEAEAEAVRTTPSPIPTKAEPAPAEEKEAAPTPAFTKAEPTAAEEKEVAPTPAPTKSEPATAEEKEAAPTASKEEASVSKSEPTNTEEKVAAPTASKEEASTSEAQMTRGYNTHWLSPVRAASPLPQPPMGMRRGRGGSTAAHRCWLPSCVFRQNCTSQKHLATL